jgi:hypothetical protein
MKSEEAMKIMDALTDVYKPPYQLIERQLQGICSFAMNHYPKEVYSDDDPPLKLAEIIPIDGYLGLYSPEKQEITIFNKAIREVSEVLQVNSTHLTIIVRLHEWAHAVFHMGVTEVDRNRILRDDSRWPAILEASTTLFREVENDLHEQIAQILTLYCISDLKKDASTDQGKEALERIECAFHLLSSRQPLEYRVKDLFDIPRSRINKSIALLRDRSLAGQFVPWKTVVTW